jgi:predicted RND superfamily exporter protein
MGFVGIPLNVVTSIVPVLLIIVGSTEDIHLLSEFRHAQRSGMLSRVAVRHMARKMGRIVLLTFITTYLGFLSVSLSGIEVLYQFGLVASTGLLLNFLITISFIPATLSLVGHWQLDGRSRFVRTRRSQAADRYWRWLYQYRVAVVAGIAAITLVAAAGIPRVQINHNVIDSLGQHSQARAHFQEVNAHLAGLQSFSIVIDSGIEDTFLKARYLEELVRMQNFIARLDQERAAPHSSTSFADYLSLLNSAFLELEEPAMPESDEVVNELMIFLNFEHVRGYVSADFSRARVVVRHDIDNTEELAGYIGTIREYLDQELDPGLTARITGQSQLVLSATTAMINGQLQSILLLMLIIVLIISLVFAELKVGLLALLPNVFPLVVLFGIMGYFGIPLNIGTTMAAAIAIGLAVDDTMHFLLRYNDELKSSRSQLVAMHATLHGEALPVIATSVALIAGFLVFTLSDFQPIVQFGILSAVVILSALVADRLAATGDPVGSAVPAGSGRGHWQEPPVPGNATVADPPVHPVECRGGLPGRFAHFQQGRSHRCYVPGDEWRGGGTGTDGRLRSHDRRPVWARGAVRGRGTAGR